MKYNIDFSIAGLLFLIGYYIYLRIQYTYDSRSNRQFRRVVIATMFADAFDIITAITISYAYAVPVWANYVLNILNFVFGVFCTLQMAEYVRYIIHKDAASCKMDWVNRAVMGIYALLAILSPVFHTIFYFNENNEYMHGYLYEISFVLSVYYLIYGIIRIFTHKKCITPKAFWSVTIFIAVAIAGVVIQVLFVSSTLLLYFSAAVAGFVILLELETPDYAKLNLAMEEIYASKKELQRLHERDEERTRTIHGLMGVASWAIDLDSAGGIVDAEWSEEFYRMLGYEKDEFDDPSYNLWEQSLHPEDKELAVKLFLDGLTGKDKYDANFRLKNKDGEYKWYKGSGKLIYDENGIVKSYQGYIQDINIEIENEMLAKERAKTLEELEKSQELLKEAVAEAEQANRAKSQFLSNMSHDIRTPMNAIVGFTDLALENMEDQSVVIDYLNRIQLSSNHLLMLINDILDMSRIESGKVTLKPEETDLKVLLSNIRDIFIKDVTERGQQFILDVDGIIDRVVLCDKLRLNQVLMNCIGNSVKFTPDGGTIKALVKQDENTNMYHFELSDTGIGMNKEFLKHIFEPFERERSSTISKTEGTGLGMSITKSVIEMMGGKIWIESERGVGTTYFIDMPFEICDEVSDIENQGQETVSDTLTLEEKAQFLKGKHFLLVDDNKTNRMVAKGVLGAFGMTIEEAGDGNQAIEIYSNSETGHFDMILMDLQMPVMGGYETTDYIKSMGDIEKASIPILAMTANAFEEDRKLCLEHGMVGHIAKPFKKEEIIDTLYSVLAK